MLTLFHVLKFIGAVAGLASGFALGGKHLGIVGAILGAIVGLLLGTFLGSIPEWLGLWSAKRSLGRETVEELRASLRDPAGLTPNLVLLELKCRGEELQRDLPIVLDMLVSDRFDKGARGWAAPTSAYPQMVEKLSDYRISDPVEECRRKTILLRTPDA